MTEEISREPGQLGLVPLQHAPMQLPRRGHVGEQTFAAVWQRFAERRHEDFMHIFASLPFDLDQRAATVAASFFTWLGTNCGGSFYDEAMRDWRERGHRSREWAFMARWAHENRREAGVNHGLRVIEFLLAPQSPVEVALGTESLNWERLPVVYLRDLDVVECIVAWLATSEGDGLVQAAREIAAGEERLQRIVGGS